MKLKQLRRNAHEKLKECAGVASPELDADLIIMHALDLSKEELLTKDPEVSDAAAVQVNAYINKRLKGVPVQYITGRTEFMSLEFEVNDSTLIPRQDTEILVEEIIKRCRSAGAQLHILDIGCGSGCIGISLARYLPSAVVCGTDISEKALKTASANAERLMVSGRTRFVRHDIKDGIDGFESDVIVSNPPYIPSGEISQLQTEVADFEPRSALDGGTDGLDFYRLIIPDAAGRGALVAFEVGTGQADAVAAMMKNHGYSDVEIIPDLSGIDRVVLGHAQ